MYQPHDVFNVQFKVKRIILEKPDSFFKIFEAVIQTQENETQKKKNYLKHKETFYATVPYVGEGDVFQAQVEVGFNKRYGFHLDVLGEPEMVMPETKAEMIKFLVKRVNGVGQKTAEKLVDAFGLDVVSEVAANKEALSSIGMVGPKADKIRAEMMKHSAYENLVAFFHNMNIPLSVATHVYESLGHESVRSIQSNPYELLEVNPKYFNHADTIANSLMKNPLSKERMRAGVLAYVQYRMDSNGDICVPESHVYREFRRFLQSQGDYQYEENRKVRKSHIEEAIKDLKKASMISTEEDNSNVTHLYLSEYKRIENGIVTNIVSLLNDFRIPVAPAKQVEAYIDELEKGAFLSEEDRLVGKTPFQLAPEQKNAVLMATKSNISILTGGPGTGKTATVNTIVQALKYANPSVKLALLAPTGKASKRMSELTHMQAMTIHRKLKIAGYGTGEGIEKIEEDFVIVDEFSMVDAELSNILLRSLGENTRVLLVGDVDQLPSIGPGLILRDLIDSERIPVTKLTQIFRQAQNSQIVMNAHKIQKGLTTKDKDGITFDTSKGDMYFVKTTSEVNIKRKIVEAVRRQVDVYHRNLNDICVLSPMRVEGLGTIELNRELQKAMNPPSDEKGEISIQKESEIIFREGDRVMHLTNDEDKNITNGEIGTIGRIYTGVTENENGTVRSTELIDVQYNDAIMGDRTVTYNEEDISEELELAYAISIHKSQGSEFPIVIMPFYQKHAHMLQRNLIYTAWTRAKEMIVNIGDTDCLDRGVRTVRNLDRISLLKEKLQNRLPQWKAA